MLFQVLVRAVVRGIDTAPQATEWVPFGYPNLQAILIEILPPAGENFVVVWEKCEVQVA
jgi:hypothetical protein